MFDFCRLSLPACGMIPHRLKEWLLLGMVPPGDQKLELDLSGPGYHINRQEQLVIESKESMQKRGLDSPDDGDALALTFAAPVRAGVRDPDVLEDPFARFSNRRSHDGLGWMAQ